MADQRSTAKNSERGVSTNEFRTMLQSLSHAQAPSAKGVNDNSSDAAASAACFNSWALPDYIHAKK